MTYHSDNNAGLAPAFIWCDMRKKRPKYNNKKTRGFDSAGEALYFEKLKLDKSIALIERQVKFTLIPSQRGADGKVIERPCSYRADFRVTYHDGTVKILDFKGMKTPEYIIKRKLMLFIHGIKVIEV